MKVTSLTRYPVKSLQGESIDACEIGPLGISGDRGWGVVDVATGNVLTARREPKLLFASARANGNGDVAIVADDGTVLDDDGALSRWLGRPVTLRRAERDAHATYEAPLDNFDEQHAEWASWRGPDGSFHDSTRARVSLVSRPTLRDWDARRFRMNIVVDTDGEDDLVGQVLAIGTARLRVAKQIDRCVMTTRPQPGGIDRDLSVLRTINAERGTFLGIGLLVEQPGRVTLGDEVSVRR
jgi:uncharacterized protein YcbX